ncbi:uncharacterized protein N7483_002359 [Penicillium malachiteum]|uniref:uncharacterized protein n=1 Tax=Penicillium malachiteum TaxID=1324776 RepID=UPI0025471C41|nr:uncharacterized protein N7483_002359 [Penicillium malachiteum]KAJ5737234.1 hypothetical protein N7483_002359 [Penicillium malachiteum]
MMVDRIKAKLDEAVESGMFLGIGYIAMHKSGKIIYSGAHGSRHFSKAESMTLETAGWVASMTKLLTCVAVMQLVERGLVGLDDDLAKIVPFLGKVQILTDFDDKTQRAKFRRPTQKITLRRLLTHSSGFIYDGDSPPYLHKWVIANGLEGKDLSGAISGYELPLVFNPGIEAISKQTLEEYMQQNIWSKVGMSRTTFHPENRTEYPILEMGIRLHGPESPLTPGLNPWGNPAHDDLGGAGLYTTTEDYAKMLAALLLDDGPLLKRESLEELIRPNLSPESRESLRVHRSNRYYVEIPNNYEVDHALGGLLAVEDIPERRRKGSISWDGRSSPSWMIDRASGVACVMLVQILPTDMITTKRLWIELETEVYKLLE